MQINIQIHDPLSPELKRFYGSMVNRRPLHAKLAGGVAKMLREHFGARDRQGNKHGWPRKHFWAKEGRQNTAVTGISDAGGEVTVASAAIAHKLKGGIIRAKRCRMLAIPLTARAYQAGSPREGGIKDLFFVKTPKAAMLAISIGNTKRIEPQYLLTPSVTHPADPRTLPPARDVDGYIQRETETWLTQHAPGKG